MIPTDSILAVTNQLVALWKLEGRRKTQAWQVSVCMVIAEARVSAVESTFLSFFLYVSFYKRGTISDDQIVHFSDSRKEWKMN